MSEKVQKPAKSVLEDIEMGERVRVDPVYRVKMYPLLLSSVVSLVGGLVFVCFTYWAAAPNWPSALRWTGWILLIAGFAGILGGFAGFIGLRRAVKEIEVGPKGIILRRRDGKKIACQKIDKITVGMLHIGRWRGRPARAVPRWIRITGQKPDGGIRTININKGGGKEAAGVALGRKELVSFKGDLQRYFGGKIEEKKVRFA